MSLVVLYMISEAFIMGSWGFLLEGYWLSLTVFEQVQLFKALFPAFNFLLSCMESLKTFELERTLEFWTCEFMKNGGAVLYHKLKQTENPGILWFIRNATEAAKKQNNSNEYFSLGFLVFVMYMLNK